MAAKTISIDLEAYRRLKWVRRQNESFSQTIKRLIRPPIDFDEWMASIKKNPLSDEAVKAVEAIVFLRSGRRKRKLRSRTDAGR
jgi:predicted CopG family antitoxin